MDKLSVMNAFCRIVERESFARAAEDLGVSPALLSREIKLLEESLGCSLLSRTTRSMSLTDHGRLYYAEAQAILDAVGGVEERLRQSAGAVRGELKVNAPQSFGQIVLAPLLHGFLTAHPELRLTMTFEDRVVDMIEGGYDLSIRVVAELPDSGLVARRIADLGQSLFAAPAYLARAGTPVVPDDLAGHESVGFLMAEHTTEWQLEGPEARWWDVPHTPRLKLGNSLALRDALIAGMGIGTLPDFVAEAPLARGELVRVLPAYALPARHVFAVTASRLGTDAKVAAFLDHLRQALAHGHS